MTPKKYAAFRIDEELLEGLEAVRERDGITPAEQVRRAIRTWLKDKRIKVKAAPVARRRGGRRNRQPGQRQASGSSRGR